MDLQAQAAWKMGVNPDLLASSAFSGTTGSLLQNIFMQTERFARDGGSYMSAQVSLILSNKFRKKQGLPRLYPLFAMSLIIQ